MTIRFAFPVLAMIPALMLAGCGDDPAPIADDGTREASGEVLEGSISDDMLPTDQVRSQAPLAAGEESDEDSDAESE